MIVEYIRYEMKDHGADALVAAYSAAGPHLQAAPECLGYEVTTGEDAPASVIVRILWTSSEGHMQGFRKGPNFPPFLGLIRPFIGEIAEMRHYLPSGVEWSR